MNIDMDKLIDGVQNIEEFTCIIKDILMDVMTKEVELTDEEVRKIRFELTAIEETAKYIKNKIL